MSRGRKVLLALALGAAVCAVYHPILHNQFVNYDDDEYLTNNPHLRHGLHPAGIAWAATATLGANWFPVTWLSWLLDYQLFGLDPRGFHATNVLLHALSSALLFLILARATGQPAPSAAVAAVFAVHPLHVESVAWAAERKDVLSGLFWMLTTWAYVRYAARPSRRGYAVVALLLAIGLAAKPMLVTLPFVLLLMDLWPLRRLQDDEGRLDRRRIRRAAGEKLPLLALAIVSSVITIVVQRSAGAVQPLERFTPSARLLNALVSLVAYLKLAVWPQGLSVYYPHAGETVALAPAVAAGLALAVLTVVAVREWRRRSYLTVGWLWFLGTLVPVLGLVQVGQQAMADRYVYIPLVGLTIAPAFFVAEIARRWSPSGRAALVAVSALALLALAVRASAQVRVWRDSETVFRHALAVTRENPVAELNLGVALLNDGRLDEAAPHLAEAVRIHPASVEAHAALGEALLRDERIPEAVEHLRTALRIDPKSGRAHASLGRALAESGEPEEALVHFQEAVALRPDDPEVHNDLGAALARQGHFTEAILSFRQAATLKPDYAAALNNWGVALLSRRDLDEAAVRFRAALAARPDDADAHRNLGLALAGREQFEEALVHFTRAAELEPEDPEAHYHAGLALARLGRLPEAAARFRAAVAIRPDQAEAHYSLGMARAGQGAFADAIRHYEQALAVRPGYAEAHHGWAIALASLGRTGEAERHFRLALALRPDFAEAHNDFGLALARQGRLAEAVGQFRTAVTLRPDYADAHNNLGVFLARLGHLPEAAEEFRRALRLQPGHPDAGANLQKMLAGRRDAPAHR